MCLDMPLSFGPLPAQAAGASGDRAAGLRGCLVRLPQRREQPELCAVGRQPASEQAGFCLGNCGSKYMCQSWEGVTFSGLVKPLPLCTAACNVSQSQLLPFLSLAVECREDFERVLAGQRFAFCLLVHTDVGSPMIDFLDASSMLQVHLSNSCTLEGAAQECRHGYPALP